MTVTELINRQKIEEAKRLLDSRPDSVGEVGTMLGYSSQSYFCTVFRRCTGMTPGQYIAGQKGIRH
jgi:AraC-like DNA-binding protein